MIEIVTPTGRTIHCRTVEEAERVSTWCAWLKRRLAEHAAVMALVAEGRCGARLTTTHPNEDLGICNLRLRPDGTCLYHGDRFA